MQAAKLDREARARRFMRAVDADLRLLGYTDRQLERMTTGRKIEIRVGGFSRLQAQAPPSRHAA